MPDLGDAYVNIIPKAPGIERNIQNLLGRGASGAGDSAGQRAGSGFVSGLKKMVAAAAVGKIIKDAFSAGGDLQQSFGGLDTIYGDAAEAAKKYAVEAAQAGISANSYAEQAVSVGAALKQAFGGDTNAAMEAANTAIMDMTDNAAKMGTPLQSIQDAYQGFAKQNYTMLDNLKLGYGGTQAEMQRLLTDAEALSGVKYDIGNLGDVYEAIHVIQGELGLTGVAAQEAETTLTGSFGAVKASWTNVLAALTTGEGLDVAVQNLSTTAGNFANVALTMFGSLLEQVPTLISGIGGAVIDNAPQLLASAAELIGQLVVGFLNGIPTFIENIPTFFTEVKAAFAEIDWVSLGRSIIDGIVAGVVAAASRLWEAVKNVVRGALGAGKAEAEVGSPSRLFARELGHWIPAGVAVGVEGNLSPVNKAISRMTDSATAEFQRAKAPGMTAGRDQGVNLERLLSAAKASPVPVNIYLQGDARKFFKVVREENGVRAKATGYNALARA